MKAGAKKDGRRRDRDRQAAWSWRQYAIVGRIGKLQLDGVGGAVGCIRALLLIANVADLTVIRVVPSHWRAGGKGEVEPDIRIRDRFRQFMTGYRRVIAEDTGCTAAGRAAAPSLHIGHNTVKKMFGVQCA